MAKMGEILDKLFNQTEIGGVAWHTTADKRTFLASFGDYAAVISKDQATSDIELKFLDKRGDTFEAVTSSGPNRWGGTHIQLFQLYGAAERQVREMDSHLDNLAKAIDAAGVD